MYALAQHIQLNESGWWDNALEISILDALYRSPKPRAVENVAGQVVRELGAELDRSRIAERIDKLQADEKIHRGESGALVLAEFERQRLDAERADAATMEAAVTAKYEKLLAARGLTGRPSVAWDRFHSNLIVPVVNELGARTLRLLSGESNLPDTAAFRRFLDKLDGVSKDEVRALATEFLDPADGQVRLFILGRLNFYLLASAGSVDRITLDAVVENRNPAFNLVLDTNVVFSILNLHRNPSNEAVKSLRPLADSVHDGVAVNLYVIPPTLEEAREALQSAMLAAPGGRVTRSLAEAGARRHDISGLAEQYFNVAARTGMSPVGYFQPYIDDLESFMADHGISTYDEGVSEVAELPELERDVENWYSSEATRTGGRSRARIRHDLHLWHFVDRHRPDRVTGAVDASWWVLTGDFQYQRRDTIKRQGNRKGPPRTINPADLAQMLRFFVPRSDRVEQALLGSIRFPFAFFQYQKKGERTSMAILDRLSRMTNVDDIPTDLAVKLLEDKAVRASIEDEKSDDAVDGAFRSAIAAELAFAEDRLRSATAENKRLVEDLQRMSADQARRSEIGEGRERSKRTLLTENERLGKVVAKERVPAADTRRRLKEAEVRRAEQEQEIARLRAAVDGLQQRQQEGRAYAVFWVLAVVLAVVVVLAGVTLGRVDPPPSLPRWLFDSGVGLVGGLLYLGLLNAAATRIGLPESSRILAYLRAGRNGLGSSIVSGVVGGIIGAILSAFS